MRVNARVANRFDLAWDYLSRSTGHLAALTGLGLLALFLARAPLTWAAAGLAGAALFLAIAIEPVMGLLTIGLAIPFGGLVALPLPAGMTIVDLLVALTVAAWLAQGVARRALIFRPPPLAWSLLTLVWVLALSLTQATSWREGLPEWLKWAEFAMLYLTATQVLRPRHIWWMLAALFTAGLAEVALGAYQFVRRVGPEGFVLMGRFMRAYGTFRQPNPYAGYLGYLAPVAAGLALGLWQSGGLRYRLRQWELGLACGGVALALVAGIGMSWSRGAWLGLAAGLAVVFGLHLFTGGSTTRRAAFWIAAGLLIVALIVALFGTGWLPEAITGRLSDLRSYISGPDPAHTEITDANFAVLERVAHWQAALKMFDDHPWLGVGIGNYAVAYAAYALPHWYEPLGHAHNVYLNFLAEAGVLGLAAFVLFWLSAVWTAGRAIFRADAHGGRDVAETRRVSRALAIGVLGTLVYLTVHNLFDNLFVGHIQLQLALLLAGLTIQEAKAV